MWLLKKALSMVNGFDPMIVLYLMLEVPVLETSRPFSFKPMALTRLSSTFLTANFTSTIT